MTAFLALAGFPQPVAQAADITPPTGTIVINSNRSATNTRDVTLALTWSDGAGGSGVSRMRFSNDGATWSAWEGLAAAHPYTLPPGADGHRTVRVQYLDKSNNRSSVFSDYILLDTTPPTGGMVINGGAATTISLTVSLGLSWSDGMGSGVTRMRFSDNGSTWSAWESLKTTRAHTLPAGLCNHTVRVQYMDGVGNYSAAYSDYIKLVTTLGPGTTETVLLPGNVPLTMVWIPGGTFQMGRYAGEQDSYSNEDPQHWVSLGGYWMAKYELTKRQWTAVMGTTPWTGRSYVLTDLDSPAVYVSWNNAQSFLTAVNSHTGKTFRLPSEAQWEHACRAGNHVPMTRFYWGDDPGYTAIGDYACYGGNAYSVGQQYAHVVGEKVLNPFGLYDMSGNVWEWCQDWYHSSYTGAPTDGSAWESSTGSTRVLRGGSWYSYDYGCRSAARFNTTPDVTNYNLGFRIAGTP
jgi:formylglycine-generating enzyme required for sulfatase activity